MQFCLCFEMYGFKGRQAAKEDVWMRFHNWYHSLSVYADADLYPYSEP